MSLVNECQFRAVSGGLGDFVVSSAITGFFTPEQCTNPVIIDGGTYHWRAESDDFSQHELFTGTYDNATDTVVRTTILQSSNGGAKVNFSAAPRVRQVTTQQDLATTGFSRTLVTAAVIDYHVNGGTGNDLNDGSIGSPWATIQRAIIFVTKEISVAATVDLIRVNVADGVYDETIHIGEGDGIPSTFFELEGESVTGTIIRPTTAGPSAVLQVGGPTIWSIKNIDVDGTATSPKMNGISIINGAIAFLASAGDLRIGGCNYAYIDVEQSAFALINYTAANQITFYGAFEGESAFFYLYSAGFILLFSPNIVYEDSPTAFYKVFNNTSFIYIFGTWTETGTTTANSALLQSGFLYCEDTAAITPSTVFLDAGSTFNNATGVRTKAGAVVAADLAVGSSQVIHDTSGNTYALYANIGGTLRSVALT